MTQHLSQVLRLRSFLFSKSVHGVGSLPALGLRAVHNSSCTSTASTSTSSSMSRPPLPPFTEETARKKVQMAEDGWNTRDPDRVALAYTEDSEWRNRGEFIRGRDAIREFLRRKWSCEQAYRLRKYLWTFNDNRIAVCFEYEYHDDSGQWYRAYGNENWEFDQAGLMRKRIASVNEAPISPDERRIAVDAAASPPVNTWLEQQGVSGSGASSLSAAAARSATEECN